MRKDHLQAMKNMEEFFPKDNWSNIHVDEWLKIKGCGQKMITWLLENNFATLSKGGPQLPKEKHIDLYDLLAEYDQ